MHDLFAIHRLVWTALLAALIAAGAFIAIPLPISPVSVTLQTLFIVLAGLILGPKYGLFAVLLYIVAGAFGLPIFSGGKGGVGVLLGPTGGYFVGFIVCVIISGKARNLPFFPATLLCFAALMILLSLGSLRLAQVLNVPLSQAFVLGLVPFVPGGIIKTLCALAIFKFLRANRLLPLDAQHRV